MRQLYSNEGGCYALFGMLLILLGCLATVTQAQERLGIVDPLGRSGPPSLPTLEEQPS